MAEAQGEPYEPIQYRQTDVVSGGSGRTATAGVAYVNVSSAEHSDDGAAVLQRGEISEVEYDSRAEPNSSADNHRSLHSHRPGSNQGADSDGAEGNVDDGQEFQETSDSGDSQPDSMLDFADSSRCDVDRTGGTVDETPEELPDPVAGHPAELGADRGGVLGEGEGAVGLDSSLIPENAEPSESNGLTEEEIAELLEEFDLEMDEPAPQLPELIPEMSEPSHELAEPKTENAEPDSPEKDEPGNQIAEPLSEDEEIDEPAGAGIGSFRNAEPLIPENAEPPEEDGEWKEANAEDVFDKNRQLWNLTTYKDRHGKTRARRVLRFVTKPPKIELGVIKPDIADELTGRRGKGRWKQSRTEADSLRLLAVAVAEHYRRLKAVGGSGQAPSEQE